MKKENDLERFRNVDASVFKTRLGKKWKIDVPFFTW